MKHYTDAQWDKAEARIHEVLDPKYEGKKMTVMRWRADNCFSVLVNAKAIGRISLVGLEADLAKVK